MTNFALPSRFKLACYRLTLEAIDDLRLPQFKGSALRGGFGHTFKRLACMEARRCNKNCQRGNSCAYGYVFETAPPQNSEVLRNFSEVPRPFIIAPIEEQREPRKTIRRGEKLTFGLTLIGHGINHLPYFLVVFKEMGQVGLGRGRGKYRLVSVLGVDFQQNGLVPVYDIESETIAANSLALTGKDITNRAAVLPDDRVTLEFVTPTRLKQRGKWVWDGPPFEVLVRSLLGRLSSLSYFHCGERLEVDFRGLIDRAAEVQIINVETHWEDWDRFSTRQKQWIAMGGLVGRVIYKSNLVKEYLSLLSVGEFIHVGKGNVFGNGQYRIVRP